MAGVFNPLRTDKGSLCVIRCSIFDTYDVALIMTFKCLYTTMQII